MVADFVDLYDGDIVEIADSESDESLERKKKIYEYYGFNIVTIRV